MSGHSKWATIKRKKGATDAARGKLFTKLIKEIVVAARMGGGDIDGNPRLRKAVGDAKGNQMPNDTIQRAIKRGTGEIAGASIDEVLYEGTGPGGTLFLVAGATDNRNRTISELRKVFEKHNGSMEGSAQWAFDHVGTIVLDKSVEEDQLMEVAVGAGAEDYRDEGDTWLVVTPVTELYKVLLALEEAKIEAKESGLSYLPKTKKEIEGRDAEVAFNLAEALDDHDDVQNVYTDFDISEDELKRITGG